MPFRKNPSYTKRITKKDATEVQADCRFLIIGDWGGIPYPPYYSENQKRVAAQMAKNASVDPINFVVSTGDNLYFHGVDSEYDDRFKHTFEEVFDDKSLDVRWHMVPGNHDYEGDIQAQINYTKLSKKWYFPSLYYAENFPLEGGRTLTCIFLDTVQLCGMPLCNLRWTTIGPDDEAAAERQWVWLKQQLEAARDSDFLVVVGHYPTASRGLHGAAQETRDRLTPLMHQHRVNLYLCGHDHLLQHFTSEQDQWTLHHCVIGTGSMTSWDRYPLDKPRVFTEQLCTDVPGFGAVSIEGDFMKLQYVDSRGSVLHRLSSVSRKLAPVCADVPMGAALDQLLDSAAQEVQDSEMEWDVVFADK